MKRITSLVFCSFFLFTAAWSQAQAELSISKNLGVFVFPTNDQDKEQQEYDEFKCYKWAMEQTGLDPMNMPEVQVQMGGTSPGGEVVGGAARGAASGAIIGAIAGDAGKGAAIGAAAGGMRGMGNAARKDAAQKQGADRAKAQKEAEMMDQFTKAFSVCMEGKGYTVK